MDSEREMEEKGSEGKSSGFSFADVYPGIANPGGMTGAKGFRVDAINERTDLVTSVIQTEPRVELFTYFRRMPTLDYWMLWPLYHAIEAYVDDMDSTKQVSFFELYPDLDFAGSGTTRRQKINALYETIKRYFYAVHQVVAAAIQQATWMGMRGFPIADRLMSTLTATRTTTWLQQLKDFPISSVVVDYLFNTMRVLQFKPEPSVQIFAYPLILPADATYVEGECHNTFTASLWEYQNDGSLWRTDVLPAITELDDIITVNSASVTRGAAIDAELPIDGAGVGCGMLPNYIRKFTLDAKTNLFEAISNGSSVVSLQSHLRELMDKIGIFNANFDWREILNRANSQPVYDGLDFVQQAMIFRDKPRPIMKMLRNPHYGVSDIKAPFMSSKPYEAIIDSDRDPNLGLLDRYEYVAIPRSVDEASMMHAIETDDWTNSSVPVASKLYAAPWGETTLARENDLFGRPAVRHVMEGWLAPYHVFYNSQASLANFTLQGDCGEDGLMFINKDEYQNGLLIPRLAIAPASDHTDPFFCGFFKVCMTEWISSDSWSRFALALQVSEDGTEDPVNRYWADHHDTLKDGLLWVGEGILSNPNTMLRNPLAAARSRAYTAGLVTSEAYTLAALPFKPFTFNYYSPSVPFTDILFDQAVGAYSGTEWADASLTPVQGVLGRLLRWTALDYWDQYRPYGVKVFNLMPALKSTFDSYTQAAQANLAELFTTYSVKTDSVANDVIRYFSEYRKLAGEKAPLIAGSSRRNFPLGLDEQPRTSRPYPDPVYLVWKNVARQTPGAVISTLFGGLRGLLVEGAMASRNAQDDVNAIMNEYGNDPQFMKYWTERQDEIRDFMDSQAFKDGLRDATSEQIDKVNEVLKRLNMPEIPNLKHSAQPRIKDSNTGGRVLEKPKPLPRPEVPSQSPPSAIDEIKQKSSKIATATDAQLESMYAEAQQARNRRTSPEAKAQWDSLVKAIEAERLKRKAKVMFGR